MGGSASKMKVSFELLFDAAQEAVHVQYWWRQVDECLMNGRHELRRGPVSIYQRYLNGWWLS